MKRSKILFDKAFKKQPWSVYPSIIQFLTPMKLCEARLEDDEGENGLLLLTAPVNHNKLNQNKEIQIVHTLLGNAYQHEQEATIANQDFRNDACIIVGYHDKSTSQPLKNRVNMKDLHLNEDEVQQKIYRGLFPPNTDTLTQLIESPDFQQLICYRCNHKRWAAKGSQILPRK